MELWRPLAQAVWDTWTPVVVLAFLVARVLAKSAPRPVERYHLRAAGTLIVSHLIALTVGVGQKWYGYEGKIALVTSFSFESLAVVIISVTAVFRALLPRIGFQLPRILIDLVTAVGTLIVFIAIGKRAGFSVAGLITTSAVLTAVIGFSLQDTLGNVMGGLSVQLDKSIAVGDWVSINNVSGRIHEIRWRYTAIETRDWDTVIIPNGVMVKSQVTILGKRTNMPLQTRRELDFFVDYQTPPTAVIETVEDALSRSAIPRVAVDPKPNVLYMGIKDGTAQYSARYWLDDLAVDDGTDSAVRTRIWFALKRESIPLAIPVSTVYLTHETDDRAARRVASELDQRLRSIAKVDLFSGLAPDVQKTIASHVALSPFAPGESVTREGEHDDGLFVIVEGTAVVRIGKGDEAREVARLGAGQFFGEMSLMTGEARTATVIAATDLVCYRLDKAAFEDVIQATPALAEDIAEVLATRKSALTAARDERDSDRRARMETEKRDFASRIRGFFGLDAPR